MSSYSMQTQYNSPVINPTSASCTNWWMPQADATFSAGNILDRSAGGTVVNVIAHPIDPGDKQYTNVVLSFNNISNRNIILVNSDDGSEQTVTGTNDFVIPLKPADGGTIPTSQKVYSYKMYVRNTLENQTGQRGTIGGEVQVVLAGTGNTDPEFIVYKDNIQNKLYVMPINAEDPNATNSYTIEIKKNSGGAVFKSMANVLNKTWAVFDVPSTAGELSEKEAYEEIVVKDQGFPANVTTYTKIPPVQTPPLYYFPHSKPHPIAEVKDLKINGSNMEVTIKAAAAVDNEDSQIAANKLVVRFVNHDKLGTHFTSNGTIKTDYNNDANNQIFYEYTHAGAVNPGDEFTVSIPLSSFNFKNAYGDSIGFFNLCAVVDVRDAENFISFAKISQVTPMVIEGFNTIANTGKTKYHHLTQSFNIRYSLAKPASSIKGKIYSAAAVRAKLGLPANSPLTSLTEEQLAVVYNDTIEITSFSDANKNGVGSPQEHLTVFSGNASLQFKSFFDTYGDTVDMFFIVRAEDNGSLNSNYLGIAQTVGRYDTDAYYNPEKWVALGVPTIKSGYDSTYNKMYVRTIPDKNFKKMEIKIYDLKKIKAKYGENTSAYTAFTRWKIYHQETTAGSLLEKTNDLRSDEIGYTANLLSTNIISESGNLKYSDHYPNPGNDLYVLQVAVEEKKISETAIEDSIISEPFGQEVDIPAYGFDSYAHPDDVKLYSSSVGFDYNSKEMTVYAKYDTDEEFLYCMVFDESAIPVLEVPKGNTAAPRTAAGAERIVRRGAAGEEVVQVGYEQYSDDQWKMFLYSNFNNRRYLQQAFAEGVKTAEISKVVLKENDLLVFDNFLHKNLVVVYGPAKKINGQYRFSGRITYNKVPIETYSTDRQRQYGKHEKVIYPIMKAGGIYIDRVSAADFGGSGTVYLRDKYNRLIKRKEIILPSPYGASVELFSPSELPYTGLYKVIFVGKNRKVAANNVEYTKGNHAR